MTPPEPPPVLVPSLARLGLASAMLTAPAWVRDLILAGDERAAPQLDAMTTLLAGPRARDPAP